MQRAEFIRRKGINFDGAQATLLELDVQGRALLSVEQKSRGFAEQRLMADQKQMLAILKTGEAK